MTYRPTGSPPWPVSICPADASANATQVGFSSALALFHEASKRVPAYRAFLAERGVVAEDVRTPRDFRQVPPVDKDNYFSRYSLEEMSWDGKLAPAKYISMSSGSTGKPFFWPRGAFQDEVSGAIFQKLYEQVFATQSGSSLFLNTFVLGAWMAGMEVYGSTLWTADRGSHIVVTTPGPDKAEVISEVKALASRFDRVILAGYPPFVKDVLELGIESGVDWSKLDVRLMVAGEAASERWRDRVLQMIGKAERFDVLVNVYGMAESGIVAHETPASIAIRRSLKQDLSGKARVADITGMYQFYPSVRYFEAGDEENLILTSPAGLPLVRFNTRDEGGVLDYGEALAMTGGAAESFARQHELRLDEWSLPVVYLYGRRDLSITFYSLMIYAESVKTALEDAPDNARLSGMFSMATEYDSALDPRFELKIELARGETPNEAFARSIGAHVTRRLSELSSGYAKCHGTLGERAAAQVELLPYGAMQDRPGRKHRWVKRK